MKALDFAFAFNDIDHGLLCQTLDRVYAGNKPRHIRQLVKVALLAALLSALFIAAAYASGAAMWLELH